MMNSQRTLLQPQWFGEVIDAQAPDMYSINIDFGNNTYAHLFNSFAVPASKAPMFEVFGDMGAISIGAHQWYDSNGTVDIYVRDESEAGSGEGWQNDTPVPTPHQLSDILGNGIIHALDVLENGGANILSAARATHVLEIMVAAGTSLETGESIEIASTF
jgi:predicted dehydrogenase